MAYSCDYCAKTVGRGNLVSHAKNRVHTSRKPNLHYVRVLEEGTTIRRRLCTTCLHRAKRPAFAKATAGKPDFQHAVKATVAA